MIQSKKTSSALLAIALLITGMQQTDASFFGRLLRMASARRSVNIATAFLVTQHHATSCMDDITAQQAMEKRNALAIAAPSSQCSKQVPNDPKTIIFHYTAASLGRTLYIFLGHKQNAPVTSHYTISPDGIIIQHASESTTAHHAGISYWRGIKNLNNSSIGIEHVNLGYKEYPDQPDGITVRGDTREWYRFDHKQTQASIALCKKILEDHAIEPRNIVGHGDVAPGRKVDPGPFFPWREFAQAGIGAWPDMNRSEPLPCYTAVQTTDEHTAWTIKHLHLWGYTLPDSKTRTEDIIRAFQMHFRPEMISGRTDQETEAIIAALLQTYQLASPSACPCQNDAADIHIAP